MILWKSQFLGAAFFCSSSLVLLIQTGAVKQGIWVQQRRFEISADLKLRISGRGNGNELSGTCLLFVTYYSYSTTSQSGFGENFVL
jgi:hypothetical protein